MGSRIKISSSSHSEFNSRFEVDREIFDVQTEDLGGKIITRIYEKGEILYTATSDYSDLVNLPDLHERVRVIMETQHTSAMEGFLKQRSMTEEPSRGDSDEIGKGVGVGGSNAEPDSECSKTEKSKKEYAAEMAECIRQKDNRAALNVVRAALAWFPTDPFFLSYCGYFVAFVENKPREGTKICEEAIKILKKAQSDDEALFLPRFYLHLGKAYLRGERKRLAMKAFKEGLKYDSRHPELQSEILNLGTRNNPVLPFLDRAHPINIYLGKMRYKLQNKK